MKVGLSNNLVDDSLQPKVEALSRQEISQFLDDVIRAKMEWPKEMPTIEASRSIINHYNRQNIKAFDEVGYFVIQGVRVCETGKLDAILNRDGLTSDQVNFGGK